MILPLSTHAEPSARRHGSAVFPCSICGFASMADDQQGSSASVARCYTTFDFIASAIKAYPSSPREKDPLSAAYA